MLRRLAACGVITAVVLWAFAPVREFAFLNWDDDAVIVRNAALDGPGVVRWAFTTTYMEHYQPLSWLVWAAIKRTAGLDPASFHVANLAAHITCALLVLSVTSALLQRIAPSMAAGRREIVAAIAALIYALHPLRVEVVAWVSALPYSLALAFAMGSVRCWLSAGTNAPRRWRMAALLLFVISLAARPIALGLPIVLVVLDRVALERRLRESLARVWPFALAAVAAAVAEAFARAPGANETPWLYRIQSAALAPLVYVWHTVAPLRLTPLDLLPAHPVASPLLVAAALLTLALASLAAWRWRRRWPWLLASLVAYLALLAPAAGLIPSGLQATADRYSYLPGVVLAVSAIGAAAAWSESPAWRTRIAAFAAAAAIALSAAGTRQTLTPWSDSISLWTRVVDLNPAHDIGLYNLATALAAAGRSEDATARYREALAADPENAAARANLARLEATRLEREGNVAAARGDLAGAAENYRRAVALDPRRTHAQAGLAMALASLGRSAEAIPALREAIAQGTDDPAIPNALAGLLAESGHGREARVVLEAALAKHPTDVNLGHNLARLLVTDPQFAASDAPLALRLASAIADATGARDPRALDTLAAALAINGRKTEAAETSDRAARLAAEQGDRDLAVQITARGRAYRNPGR